MNPEKFQEYIAYLEKKPVLFDEACRQVPDLFIARLLRAVPCQMHVDLQRYLDAAGPTKTILLPRNHGKTTQVDIGRVPWEIGHNPDLRVQIVQATLPDAKKTVRAVKEVMESETYQRVFPHIKPSKEDWGTTSISVAGRKAGMRDSTVTAQPIFGKAGQRSDLLLLDDVENFDNSIRQETVREQVKAAYRETWLPTLEPGGREWRNATPWHIDGITMEWKAVAAADGSLFMRVCDGVERSPWPEKFDADELARRRVKMGEIAYARAFLLQPLTGDEVVFREEDLRSGFAPLPKEEMIRGRSRWASIDLAFSDAEQVMKRNKHSPDFAVMAVADLDAGGHVWMVRVMRLRCSYPDFRTKAVAEAQRLGVQRVKIESNGPQKGFRQDLGRAFGEVGISHKKEDRATDKHARAFAVQHIVEQGRFHLRTTDRGELFPDMVPMFDELRMFPVTGKDDCLDAAVDLMAEARVLGAGPMAGRRVPDPTIAADIEKDAEAMDREEVSVGEYAQHHGLDWDDEND